MDEMRRVRWVGPPPGLCVCSPIWRFSLMIEFNPHPLPGGQGVSLNVPTLSSLGWFPGKQAPSRSC